MNIKKEKIIRASGIAAIIGIPTFTTIGVVYGTAEDVANFDVKPPETWGEEFFDQNIKDSESHFIAQNLLTPYQHTMEGGDLSSLLRLDENMDSNAAHTLIKDGVNGEDQQPLIRIQIGLSDVLRKDDLEAKLKDANIKLYQFVQSHPELNMGVYIGKDVQNRVISASVYEIKSLSDDNKAIAEQYFNDIGTPKRPGLNADGTINPNEFLQVFSSENVLTPQQVNYFRTGKDIAALRSKYGTFEIGNYDQYNAQKDSNGFSVFVSSGQEPRYPRTLDRVLAEKNLIPTYNTSIDWAKNEFTVVYSMYEGNKDTKLTFSTSDQVFDPVAVYRKEFKIPLSNLTSGIAPDATKKANAVPIVKKFFTEDLIRYIKEPIVAPGLGLLGKFIGSLGTVLDEFVSTGNILGYDTGTCPYPITDVRNPAHPQYKVDPTETWHQYIYQDIFTDDFIERIIDIIAATPGVDFNETIKLMSSFEVDSFGTNPYWTKMEKLMEMYVDNGGIFRIYTISSLTAAVSSVIYEEIKAHHKIIELTKESDLVTKLIKFLHEKKVLVPEINLNDILKNPFSSIFDILNKMGELNVHFPMDIAKQLLPIIPLNIISQHADGFAGAISYLTEPGNIKALFTLLGDTVVEQKQTFLDLLSSDKRWDAFEKIFSNTHASARSLQVLFTTISKTGILPKALEVVLGDTEASADTYSKLFANGTAREIYLFVKKVLDRGLVEVNGPTKIEGVSITSSSYVLTAADKEKVKEWFHSLPVFFKRNIVRNSFTGISSANLDAGFDTEIDKPTFTTAELTELMDKTPVNEFTVGLVNILEHVFAVAKLPGGMSITPGSAQMEIAETLILMISETFKKSLASDDPFTINGQLATQNTIISQLPLILAPFGEIGKTISGIMNVTKIVGGVAQYGIEPYIQNHIGSSASTFDGKIKILVDQILKAAFPSGFAKGDENTPEAEKITNDQAKDLIVGLLGGFSSKTDMWNAMSPLVPATYKVEDIPIVGSLDLDIKKILEDIYSTGTFSKSILVVTAHPDQNLGNVLQKILKTGLLSLTKDDFKNLIESLKRPIKATGFLSGTAENAANDAITELGPIAGILGLINREGSDGIAQSLFDILHKPLNIIPVDDISNLLKFIDATGLLNKKDEAGVVIKEVKLAPLANAIQVALSSGIQYITPIDVTNFGETFGLSETITSIISSLLVGDKSDDQLIQSFKTFASSAIIPAEVQTVTGAETVPSYIGTYAGIKRQVDDQITRIGALGSILPPVDGEISTDKDTREATNAQLIKDATNAYELLRIQLGKIEAYNDKAIKLNKEFEFMKVDLKSKITAIPTKKLPTDSTMTLPTIDFDATLAKVTALTNNIIDGMDAAHLKEAEGRFRDLVSYNAQVTKMNRDFVTLGANVETLIAQIPSIADIPLTPGATVPTQTFAPLKAKLVAFGTTSVGKTMAELTEFRRDYNNLQAYLDTVRANNAELIKYRTLTQELMNTIPAKVNLEVGANTIRGKDYDTLKAELVAITTDATTVTTAEAKSYKAKYDEIVTYIANVNTNNKELHDARLELKAKLQNIPADIAIISGADISTLRGETYASLTGALPTVADVDTKSVVEIRQINVKYDKIATYLTRVTALNKDYTDLKAEVTAIAATALPTEVTVLPSVADISGLKGVTYAALKNEWDALVVLNVAGITKADLTQLKTDLKEKLRKIEKYNENVGKLNSGGKIGISDDAEFEAWLLANADTVVAAISGWQGNRQDFKFVGATSIKRILEAGVTMYYNSASVDSWGLMAGDVKMIYSSTIPAGKLLFDEAAIDTHFAGKTITIRVLKKNGHITISVNTIF